MTPSNRKIIDTAEALYANQLENLTMDDAILLVAVCAANEKANAGRSDMEEAKRIAKLAEDHPLFSERKDMIEPSINMHMNMLKTGIDLINVVATAAKVLPPKLKKTAFYWITEILMPYGVLTKERKDVLDKYALLLGIDSMTAQKIPVKVSDKM
jgi:hypothetical protein